MEAVLLAAGQGVRMRSDKPKQFLRLAGKPLLVHSLEVLECIRAIDKVWVTHAPGFEEELTSLFEQYQLLKPSLVQGGTTRQDSVRRGLECVRSERVLIHEAVRPFITRAFLEELISHHGVAVVPTVPITFTVAEGTDKMERRLERDRLHNIQLPQVYETSVLRRAHACSHDGSATEDSQLVFELGLPVRFVTGLEYNIKITTPLDLRLAEEIYEQLLGWDSLR